MEAGHSRGPGGGGGGVSRSVPRVISRVCRSVMELSNNDNEYLTDPSIMAFHG